MGCWCRCGCGHLGGCGYGWSAGLGAGWGLGECGCEWCVYIGS